MRIRRQACREGTVRRPVRFAAEPLERRRLLDGSISTASPVQDDAPDLRLESNADGTIDANGILAISRPYDANAVVLGVYDAPDGADDDRALIVPRTLTFGSPAYTDIFGTSFYELNEVAGATFGPEVDAMMAEIGASVALPILLGKLYVSRFSLNEEVTGGTSDGGFVLAYRFTLGSNAGEPNPVAADFPFVYPSGVGFDFDLTIKWDADRVGPILSDTFGTSDVDIDTTVLPDTNGCEYVRILPAGVATSLTSWRYDPGELTNVGVNSLARLESSFRDVEDDVDDASVSEDDFASGFVGDARIGSILGFASFDPMNREADLDDAKRLFVEDVADGGIGNTVSMNFWALVPDADAPVALRPQLEVRGQGEVIEDGDAAATADDGTNFGTVTLGKAKLRTFDLRSVGSAALTLGDPAIQISGPGAASFAVVSEPDGTIEVDESSSLVLRFTPAATGVQTATITIRSNDATGGDAYTFVVKGTGAADANAPTFAVLAGGTLTVTGTRRDDAISVRRDGASVKAVLGGATMTFAASSVRLVAVEAGAGDDRVDLSRAPVPATVNAGDGDDRVIGTPLADSLSGNAGRDALFGGTGGDRLAGNGGRDKLHGDGGADRLFGGASGDWLFGGGGADEVAGEGGNDQLFGGGDADVLRGNAGNDTLVANDGVADRLFGDGGIDTGTFDDGLDIVASVER